MQSNGHLCQFRNTGPYRCDASMYFAFIISTAEIKFGPLKIMQSTVSLRAQRQRDALPSWKKGEMYTRTTVIHYGQSRGI